MYIWFTMLPIGAVYVIFRAILKLIRARKFQYTTKRWLRNILLALIPFGILLVCHGLSDVLGFHWTAGFLFMFLYPVSGIVLLILFAKSYIFNRPWGNIKKVLFFFLTLFLWIIYMLFPPTAYGMTMMRRTGTRKNTSYFGPEHVSRSPDLRVEAVYYTFVGNRLNPNYFFVLVEIRSHNPEIDSSPAFQTTAPAAKNVKIHWYGPKHFIFKSSDVGEIDFQYRSGKWTASPESLLRKKEKNHAE